MNGADIGTASARLSWDKIRNAFCRNPIWISICQLHSIRPLSGIFGVPPVSAPWETVSRRPGHPRSRILAHLRCASRILASYPQLDSRIFEFALIGRVGL